MNEVGIEAVAHKTPGDAAIVAPDGATWTWMEVRNAVNRLARAFVDNGLSEGDAVAILAPNCAEYLVAHLAAQLAGLYTVPMNWHLSETEIAFLLEDSAARAVVAHSELGPKRCAAIARHAARADLLVSIGDVPGFVPLVELTSAYAPEPLPFPPRGRMMAYTSATTGRPKAVKMPLRNLSERLVEIARANEELAGLRPSDGSVHLCASMLYHSAPLTGSEVALHMGHRVVLLGAGWSGESLLRAIEEHRVTTTFMVPTMFVRLLKLPDEVRNRYSVDSLRLVVHGAAPCPVEVKRRMIEWWGDVIWEAYAATETQGTLVGAKEWLERPGTVGKPLAGVSLKILDKDGGELPPSTPGLIYLHSRVDPPFEYKGDPEKTRRAKRGDYVTVGDVGYVDDKGYLYLCGRETDLIISSGMNIYPAEIESALVQHPLVSDCAVVGQSHELLGEVPKAFVQLEPGTAPDQRPEPRDERSDVFGIEEIEQSIGAELYAVDGLGDRNDGDERQRVQLEIQQRRRHRDVRRLDAARLHDRCADELGERCGRVGLGAHRRGSAPFERGC